ncbi:S8 family peptidase [Mycolicibacterium cosmeticum]|uniref:S8 family peptidase n=1 Tax=Mycolicibacterium cosmeticum TaxID=258533 RepID=UPI003204803E
MANAEDDLWADRVMCAMGDLASIEKVDVDRLTLRQAVAARFASRFGTNDRRYQAGEPQWHHSVEEAVGRLVRQKKISRPRSRKTLRLTKTGERALSAACQRAMEQTERALPATPTTGQSADKDPVLGGVLAPPLREKFVDEPRTGAESFTGPVAPPTEPVMVELNLRYQAGVAEALQRVRFLWHLVGAAAEPVELADQYLTGDLTRSQLEAIVSADAAAGDWPKRAIYRIWPDFEARPQIDASGATIKARAAQRTFESFGDGIVWAVVDSGIAGDHPHFLGYETLTDPSVKDLHRDFTAEGVDPALALIDDDGHGTHVAGIIAGGLEKWDSATRRVIATQKRFNVASPDDAFPIIEPREVSDINRLAGMAPRAKLVSLKVLGGGGDRVARVSRVIRALAYVREQNAASDKVMRIHGVNLSLGYEFDAQWYACGQSPLCVEVDKLVRSGVVVVVAAGNTGYVTLNPKFATDVTKFTAYMTINDPGNAERAITVGATHRDSPHTYGVSYFSSRGPTGDGRHKPDLVAPGERITSAAAGANLAAVKQSNPQGFEQAAVYVEESGTSMAAPHVSGAVAAFLSVQKEMIGRPEEVKQIFVSSAVDLGRERSFQGGGLLNLLRALESV